MNIKTLHSNFLFTYNQYFEQYSLTNPLFCISPNKKKLTWLNYRSKESFYTYEEYYNWVNNNLQYSIAISDKALIQIFFEGDGKKILKSSLAFLPNPNILMSYFRFDMDLLSCKNYYHNSYHINFGYRTDDVRYSLNKFPYPSEFIKFSLFLIGKDEFLFFKKDHFFSDLNSLGEKYSHFFDMISL